MKLEMLFARSLSSKEKKFQKAVMACYSKRFGELIDRRASALLRELQELDIFQTGIYGAEAVTGTAFGIDAHLMLTADR